MRKVRSAGGAFSTNIKLCNHTHKIFGWKTERLLVLTLNSQLATSRYKLLNRSSKGRTSGRQQQMPQLRSIGVLWRNIALSRHHQFGDKWRWADKLARINYSSAVRTDNLGFGGKVLEIRQVILLREQMHCVVQPFKFD
jgi:hypothetical protein